MASDVFDFSDLSDRALLAEVARLAHSERAATARLIASLVELDERKLYLGEGCSSLFTYCTQVIHLAEDAAYGRIAAARAARRHPLILQLLVDGSVTLTAVGLLAPHLTAENHRDVLTAARHKSKRDVERQVAALHPRPDIPSSVRKLPMSKTASSLATAVSPAGVSTPGACDSAVPRCQTETSSLPSATRWSHTTAPQKAARDSERRPTSRPPVVRPLSPERFQIQFTVGRETHDRLRRVRISCATCSLTGTLR